ncbi:hypothetical protein MJD09_24845, partial [bacterium]|nr:hypothetical protein [bacterium]
ADGNFDLFQPGKFITPEDVSVDLEGNIFVIDAQCDSLFKFSAQGDEQQSFGDPVELAGPGGQFNRPEGVAEFNKTLYIADTGNNRILRFRLSTDAGN